MAFKLALSTFTSGLEAQSAAYLCAYQIFATITPPVTEAAMRSQLETGQFQAFSNDGWGNFLANLGALPLDESALTPVELSIVNTVREAVSPTPAQACCGGVTPANSDGFSALQGNFRTGSTVTYEHQIQFTNLTSNYTCDIKTIEVQLTPIGAAPAITSANPVILSFDRCQGVDAIFSKVWTTFASDPTGQSYDVIYTYKDSVGVTVATYTAAYTLTL